MALTAHLTLKRGVTTFEGKLDRQPNLAIGAALPSMLE